MKIEVFVFSPTNTSKSYKVKLKQNNCMELLAICFHNFTIKNAQQWFKIIKIRVCPYFLASPVFQIVVKNGLADPFPRPNPNFTRFINRSLDTWFADLYWNRIQLNVFHTISFGLCGLSGYFRKARKALGFVWFFFYFWVNYWLINGLKWFSNA